MVYIRKRTFRVRRVAARRTYRKRRATYIRRRRAPLTRAPRPHVLLVKRKFFSSTWTWNTTTTADFWRYPTFNMNMLPNISEYTSLFDEYKVNALKYTFLPRHNVATKGQLQGYMHYIIDPGSTMIPQGVYGQGTLNQVLENSGVKTRSCLRPINIYYKPKTLTQDLGGGTGARVITPGWYRTTDTNIDFRGFHCYINLPNFASTAADVSFDVYITVYAQFKNMK